MQMNGADREGCDEVDEMRVMGRKTRSDVGKVAVAHEL